MSFSSCVIQSESCCSEESRILNYLSRGWRLIASRKPGEVFDDIYVIGRVMALVSRGTRDLLTIQLRDLTFEDAPGQMVASSGRVVLRKK